MTAAAHETGPRLFVDDALGPDLEVTLAPAQAHYLRNVMRLKPEARLRLFNGRDGEWAATVTALDKRKAVARCDTLTREQTAPGDLHYLFAPLKHARLDYMVQKATEMGVSRLQPVITEFTVARRVNADRMRANAIEAAEQCTMLSVPEIGPLMPLVRVLDEWDESRRLIFCDEAAAQASPIDTLGALGPGPLAVLIGPEGGFSPQEAERLRGHSCVTAISLGPRIMRADTAAVAALATVQAVLGDWRG